MPELKTFKGRPIKKMKLTDRGIRLIFVSPTRGQDGDKITVTQDEWDQHGKKQIVSKHKMPDLRRMAAEFV